MKHRIAVSLLIISIIILLIIKAEWWVFPLIFMVFLGVTAWGAFDIRLNYFVKSFSFQPEPNGNEIAITFDDGPTEFTSEILKLLDEYEAKATFFCTGKQIEKHPEFFRKIIDNGHEIGNHSYNHSNSTGFLSTEKMLEEIRLADQEFQKHQVETQLYRPPFGVTNPNIASAIKKSEKKSIGWNIRSLDTVLSDEKKISDRITRKIKPGSIILLHDSSEKSVRALEILLLNLRRQNYRCVTVCQLLRFENHV